MGTLYKDPTRTRKYFPNLDNPAPVVRHVHFHLYLHQVSCSSPVTGDQSGPGRVWGHLTNTGASVHCIHGWQVTISGCVAFEATWPNPYQYWRFRFRLQQYYWADDFFWVKYFLNIQTKPIFEYFLIRCRHASGAQWMVNNQLYWFAVWIPTIRWLGDTGGTREESQ